LPFKRISRPLILHAINSLSLGGAELLLSNTIALLPEFRHLVVLLHKPSGLSDSFTRQGVELICLVYTGWKSMPASVSKLKEIIKEKRPVLVHSHLFYSTVCARLATPASVPLVSTLHSVYGKDAFDKNIKSLLAARFTLKKRHSLIGVSDYVMQDYLSYVPFKGKRFVLHNFLPDSVFNKVNHQQPQGTIKMVAVGNLKKAKNYTYLLQIFKYLKGVSLDIYGEGELEKELRDHISKENLDVRLCGNTNDIPGIFSGYDFFIQASAHEGFGLSVIEAMASGIPVILSDIPVFREITDGLAHFFPLDNEGQAAESLREILNKPYPAVLASEAFSFVQRNFSAIQYREKLLFIYETVTQKKLLQQPETVEKWSSF
jgi:glycosyltransferase involved in cell wall biosynthesis